MEDYRLQQSGQEVQDILNGAAMQVDLTAESQRAQQAEQALNGKIDAEETRAKAAEKQNADDIDAIEEKIPSGASSSNKFATESDVNDASQTLQGNIDAEVLRAGQAEQVLDGKIDAEETRAKAAEKANADDIDAIEEKIPSGATSSNKLATASDVTGEATIRENADAALQQAIEAIMLLIPSAATSLNQLADKAFVNSSIATSTATFRGTYNLVNDLGLMVSATHAQIATALAGAVVDEDNNDYAFVQVPTSDATPTQIAKTERYKFNGTAWEYEYDLNNSGYTADQWAAINSGITAALVSKLSALPTNAELTTALGLLSDGIAAINGKIPSEATTSNKLVDTAAMQSYVTQIINAIDATFNVGSADGHVAVQITQVNGVITNVAVTTSDIASAAALTLVTGRVTDAEANIVSLGGRMTTAETDIDDLQQLYNNLQQSAPVVIDPTDTWPVAVADRSATVIYRVVDRVNTPPQYYSDYMFRASDLSGQPVLMGKYDNAIDPRPKKGSQNLVTSGGVFDNMGALDVSELNATENPHTLAIYADLSAALAAIPSDYQNGGMSIKFVEGSVGSSDDKYIQARLMADSFTTDVTQWQGVDDEPTAGSDNLIKSGGVYAITSVLGDKLIKLTGWGTSHSLAPNVGDVYYNTNSKTLKKRVQSGDSTTIVDVPYYDGAIYQYQNELYIWNGTELISKTTVANEILEGSALPISGGAVFDRLLAACENSAQDVTITGWTSGYIKMSDGTPASNSIYRYSDDIVVPAGRILAVKAIGAETVAGISIHIEGNLHQPLKTCSTVYKFFIAEVETKITISTSYESITAGTFAVKMLDTEIARTFASEYTQIIADYMQAIDTKGSLFKWNEIPDMEGAFGATSFEFNNNKGTHKVIPVKSGDEIFIDTTNARTYFAFVKSYTPPILSRIYAIDYVSGGSRTIVNASNRNRTAIAPSDAKYLIVCNVINSNNWSPTSLRINDYDVMRGVNKSITDAEASIDSMRFPLNMSYNDIPIKSGNIGNNSIENITAVPTINGHRELPVKPGQFIRVYPSETRVTVAVVNKINADGTMVRATGFAENITHLHQTGPIDVSVPFDGNIIVISEYYTSDNITRHWYAEDVLINGASIVKSAKNENLIFKSLQIENMLLGGAPITPVEFTMACPSGGDSLDDGNVCVGYYSGTTRYSESSGDSHAALTIFNMLNPILTQISYKALKDGDVVMWNQTNGQPDPQGESVVWRGKGFGSVGQTTDTCAKFVTKVNTNDTIRVLTNGANCLCYVDFDRATKTFETDTYDGNIINVGHMILLKIGDNYFSTDITSTNVVLIEEAITALDSNFRVYNRQLACDANPVFKNGYWWLNVDVSRSQCLFKSADLKVFEFVKVIPSGYCSPEAELFPYGNYLYGIVRGWKNADAENGGYSQLFRYNLNDGTFSEFVELTGLCGERPAFAIVDSKIYTINRLGNGAFAGTTIQRADKMFQVFDLDFNLLNSVHLNFIRGCNTIQFLVHAKQLYAFVPTDRRGFVFTKNAEGRNDLVWSYVDVRYLNK